MLIYIVEDDTDIRELESYAMKSSGYEVQSFGESKSFFKDVCERFVKNKRAMIALVIFLIIALMAIFGPMISPYSYDGMDTAIMLSLIHISEPTRH